MPSPISRLGVIAPRDPSRERRRVTATDTRHALESLLGESCRHKPLSPKRSRSVRQRQSLAAWLTSRACCFCRRQESVSPIPSCRRHRRSGCPADRCWGHRLPRKMSAASHALSASVRCSVRRECCCRRSRSRSACSWTNCPRAPRTIQKAFYSLLLERRLGEHHLPPGTWVVAAGNRAEDRALVRSISSALVNRVVILNVRVDNKEWLLWPRRTGCVPRSSRSSR